MFSKHDVQNSKIMTIVSCTQVYTLTRGRKTGEENGGKAENAETLTIKKMRPQPFTISSSTFFFSFRCALAHRQ